MELYKIMIVDDEEEVRKAIVKKMDWESLGYELEAIAACTIGGVSTNGGIGRISGIFVGVLVFELLKVCLQFLGVPSDYTYVVQGLVIIVAVALDIRKYLSKK